MAQRELNVLIGSSETPQVVSVRMLLGQRYGAAKVSFTVCDRLDDLLAQTQKRRYDLAVLFIQNLVTPTAPGDNRIENVITAIPGLKAGNVDKVITLSGYCPSPDFPERVRRAGADAFLLLPYERADFEAAVSSCLGASPVQGNAGA